MTVCDPRPDDRGGSTGDEGQGGATVQRNPQFSGFIRLSGRCIMYASSGAGAWPAAYRFKLNPGRGMYWHGDIFNAIWRQAPESARTVRCTPPPGRHLNRIGRQAGQADWG